MPRDAYIHTYIRTYIHMWLHEFRISRIRYKSKLTKTGPQYPICQHKHTDKCMQHIYYIYYLLYLHIYYNIYIHLWYVHIPILILYAVCLWIKKFCSTKIARRCWFFVYIQVVHRLHTFILISAYIHDTK